ncbi:MAG: hypothetical protein ACE5FO_05805 [Parvularculaceae bacterium]
MNKLLAFAAATAAAGFFSLSANAAVIDFAAEADTNGERGVASGTQLTVGGVLVQLDVPMNSSWFPYLDAGDAGLGVCQNLDASNQCVPPSDDNVTIGEDVKVTFVNGPLVITGLSFDDIDHASLNTDNVGQLIIETNLMAANTFTFAGALAWAAAGQLASWIRFEFVDTEFYVNAISTIPIPGALPLLLSGLAGLGFASRRRRKTA